MAVAMTFAVAFLATIATAAKPIDSSKAKVPAIAAPAKCGVYNTALTWYDSPSRAAEEARKQNKMLFVIQVSGNFAREEFT
jgi:hypothetical protein